MLTTVHFSACCENHSRAEHGVAPQAGSLHDNRQTDRRLSHTQLQSRATFAGQTAFWLGGNPHDDGMNLDTFHIHSLIVKGNTGLAASISA